MNKQQYHKLLQARKNEEQLIETLVLAGVKPSFILTNTDVPKRRLQYILRKWFKKGKYNYAGDFFRGYITNAIIVGHIAQLE